MTMADWAGRRLFDLGPTTHAESAVPRGATSAWFQAKSLPDLFTHHRRTSELWLVEAKGGRALNLGSRRHGASQLDVGPLVPGRHVRALCATGMTRRLSMMIDIDYRRSAGGVAVPSAPLCGPDAGPRDEAKLALAHSGTLIYLALSSLPREQLALVTVNAPHGRDQHERGSIAQPLEANAETGRSAVEMLVGTLPGSELMLGMSRPLYGACGQFIEAQRHLAGRRPRFPTPPNLVPNNDRDFDEPEWFESILHAGWDEAMSVVLAAAHRGFAEEHPSWEALLGVTPSSDRPSQRGFLEAATQDTYIAIKQ